MIIETGNVDIACSHDSTYLLTPRHGRSRGINRLVQYERGVQKLKRIEFEAENLLKIHDSRLYISLQR